MTWKNLFSGGHTCDRTKSCLKKHVWRSCLKNHVQRILIKYQWNVNREKTHTSQVIFFAVWLKYICSLLSTETIISRHRTISSIPKSWSVQVGRVMIGISVLGAYVEVVAWWPIWTGEVSPYSYWSQISWAWCFKSIMSYSFWLWGDGQGVV